jgi:hypothetical protein
MGTPPAASVPQKPSTESRPVRLSKKLAASNWVIRKAKTKIFLITHNLYSAPKSRPTRVSPLLRGLDAYQQVKAGEHSLLAVN